jgi:hypothetical protein
MSTVEIATLAISGVALLVSICTAAGTAIYTQRVTDRRELAKWRRDELLRATSELAQLSSNRQALLSAAFDSRIGNGVERIDPFDTNTTGGPHPTQSVDTMFVLVERIRLIDTGVADAAEQLAKEHRKAVQEAQALPEEMGNPIEHIEASMIYPADQARLHRQLTNAFRKATGQQPIPGDDDR